MRGPSSPEIAAQRHHRNIDTASQDISWRTALGRRNESDEPVRETPPYCANDSNMVACEFGVHRGVECLTVSITRGRSPKMRRRRRRYHRSTVRFK